MGEAVAFLLREAKGDLLPWRAQVEAADHFGTTIAEMERLALENGLLPGRYQRNRMMLSSSQQLQLFSSRVVVVGCGGLGGYHLEQLARLGVGQIVAIDPDVFEEHNLNRQLLSCPESLGKLKVEVAAARLAQINPAVTVTAVPEAFCRGNAALLLAGAHVVVDGLDSIATRLELAACCGDLGVPLVHGAIAGWYGQITTQYPGDRAVESLYQGNPAGRGIEKGLGNPAFTPAVLASLQVAEVCKVLLDEGSSLRGRTLAVDLRAMEFVETVL